MLLRFRPSTFHLIHLIASFLIDRLSLAGEEYEKFWKDIQFTVDKDVVRTDRSHPFFTGEDNPNIEKMR